MGVDKEAYFLAFAINSNSKEMMMKCTERIKKLLKSDVPLKWIFYEDSITHDAFHPNAS